MWATLMLAITFLHAPPVRYVDLCMSFLALVPATYMTLSHLHDFEHFDF